MNKRKFMILLVGVMMLLLCACGKEKSNNQGETVTGSNKENQTDSGQSSETEKGVAVETVVRVNRITDNTMIFYVKDEDIAKLDIQDNRSYQATIGVDNYLFDLSIYKDDNGAFSTTCNAFLIDGSYQTPTSVPEVNQLHSMAQTNVSGETTCYAGDREILVVFKIGDTETNVLPKGEICFACSDGNSYRQEEFVEENREEFTKEDIADQLISEKYNEQTNPFSEKDFTVTTSSSQYFKPNSEDYVLYQTKGDDRTVVTLQEYGDSQLYDRSIMAFADGTDLKSIVEGMGYIEDADGSFQYNTYHEDNGVYYVNLTGAGWGYRDAGQTKQEKLIALAGASKDNLCYASKPYLTKAQLADIYNTQLRLSSLGKEEIAGAVTAEPRTMDDTAYQISCEALGNKQGQIVIEDPNYAPGYIVSEEGGGYSANLDLYTDEVNHMTVTMTSDSVTTNGDGRGTYTTYDGLNAEVSYPVTVDARNFQISAALVSAGFKTTYLPTSIVTLEAETGKLIITINSDKLDWNKITKIRLTGSYPNTMGLNLYKEISIK